MAIAEARAAGPGAAEFVGAVPRDYNFAADVLRSNLAAGRANKPVYIDGTRTLTYGQLADRVARFGAALRGLGVRREERVLMAMLDTVDWPTAFLGCLKAGIIAVPVNTLLTEDDYRFMLADSRAKCLVVSEALFPKFEKLIAQSPDLEHVIVSGANPLGFRLFDDIIGADEPEDYTAPTTSDDMAFWLYTSGSTGKPKGAVHVHASLKLTADLYGTPVAGIKESDVCYSVAKLFFAYGLGNALTFPLTVGATTVLNPERPTPDGVAALLRKHPITFFYAVPTFYAAFLNSANAPKKSEVKIRRCLSAGEALPEEIARTWQERYGVEISDGLGTTEMLHIYLTNRPGATKYGTTGKAVPGYEIKLIGEDGMPVKQGEMGEMYARGPTSCDHVLEQPREVALDFPRRMDPLGRQIYRGRGRLLHMLRAGRRHAESLRHMGLALRGGGARCRRIRKCWRRPSSAGSTSRSWSSRRPSSCSSCPTRRAKSSPRRCRTTSRQKLAPFKYPRWIEFRSELPKTATGKIQRFKLRGGAVVIVVLAKAGTHIPKHFDRTRSMGPALISLGRDDSDMYEHAINRLRLPRYRRPTPRIPHDRPAAGSGADHRHAA